MKRKTSRARRTTARSEQLQVRLSGEELEALDEWCAQNDRTRADAVREALRSVGMLAGSDGMAPVEDRLAVLEVLVRRLLRKVYGADWEDVIDDAFRELSKTTKLWAKRQAKSGTRRKPLALRASSR